MTTTTWTIVNEEQEILGQSDVREVAEAMAEEFQASAPREEFWLRHPNGTTRSLVPHLREREEGRVFYRTREDAVNEKNGTPFRGFHQWVRNHTGRIGRVVGDVPKAARLTGEFPTRVAWEDKAISAAQFEIFFAEERESLIRRHALCARDWDDE